MESTRIVQEWLVSQSVADDKAREVSEGYKLRLEKTLSSLSLDDLDLLAQEIIEKYPDN